MSDDLFTDPLFESEEVEAPVVIPSTFEGMTTVKRSFEEGTKPLFTHKPMDIPPVELNVDLSGNNDMLSVEEILKGLKQEEEVGNESDSASTGS